MSILKSSPVLKIFLTFFIFWLGGVSGSYLTSYYLFHQDLVPYKFPIHINDSEEIIPSSRHFFSDEIVIFAQDKEGNPFLLKLDLNRKEIQRQSYSHYYWADLLYKDLKKNEYVNFYDHQDKVSTEELFTSYHNSASSDLSARESYNFSLDIEGKAIEVSLEGLNGDFIVKNNLEHTKYVSVGTAKISFEGQKFEGQAVIAKIYSSDYSKYIFFDTYNTLKSVTHYLTLWDERGNFYLIDTTKTETEDPFYKSHTWVLYKDIVANATRKAFMVDMDFKANGPVPQSWDIKIPQLFQSRLQLKPRQFLNADQSEGILEGSVTSAQGSFKIMGIFKYGVYNH